jgi:hypothetical protein
MFTKTHVPFNIESYDCPDDVKLSFYALTKSTKYTWNNNTVCFFYEYEDCDVMCNHIAALLEILKPTKPLIADVILSPVKKYYPESKIFGPENVNTGYSSNKIVVYRKEEWFKVFIHECFHFFNFEKNLLSKDLATRILNLFPVVSEVNLFESYCEFMARTINCKMISSYAKIPFLQLLKIEKNYSMCHMVNVLHHMGLTYTDILKKNSGFKEKTNVLAYVVLTNILMYNDYSPDGIELLDGSAYVSFIEQHYKDPAFIRRSNEIHPQVTTTMSILSIDDYTG